jgi:hypothetical protein
MVPVKAQTVERIMTLHPQGKSGVNISRRKYDVVKESILEALHVHVELTFEDLLETVRRDLGTGFEGSINWYFTTVKLDLEARGLLERIPASRPQRLRLGEQSNPV